MGIYNCEFCNYSVDRKNDMSKHNITNKHIKMRDSQLRENSNHVAPPKSPLKSPPVMNAVLPQIKTLNCKYCGTEFSWKQNLSRHHKTCGAKDTDKDTLANKFILLEKKVEKQAEIVEKQAEIIQGYTNSFRTIAENSTEANKASSNALSFVITNLKNAPSIEKFANFGLLMEGNTKYTMAEIAIHYYKKAELPKFIGDKLIKHYKKDNPKNQSMWNTDSNRAAYIIKELSDDESEWRTDKGGIVTSKYTVAPIFDHINNDLKRFIKESRKLLIENASDDILTNMIHAQSIIMEMESGTLNNKIIKYISNYFHLDKKHVKKLITSNIIIKEIK
jgi:hypothetical protein